MSMKHEQTRPWTRASPPLWAKSPTETGPTTIFGLSFPESVWLRLRCMGRRLNVAFCCSFALLAFGSGPIAAMLAVHVFGGTWGEGGGIIGLAHSKGWRCI